MTLDPRTLFFSMWLTVSLTIVALLVGVGWTRAGRGLRAWTVALLLQSLGWALLMVSYQGWPRELATLGAASLVGSVSAMVVAAQHYLGGSVSRVWVWGPPLLSGVVHWWVFEHFAARIVVINLTLGLQMVGLGALLLRSRSDSPGRGRWRWLAAAGLLASAPLVLARAALVIWAPADYPSFESPHWLNVVGLMVNGACLGIGTLAFLMAHRDEAEAQLARLATQDPLTGLLNRRSLMEQGERLVQLARRHGAPLTVMMFDIDHFKRINDERGHPTGDRVIAHFAAALHSTLREGDVVGRYGGEEFVAVLYDGGLDTAASVDARLRVWLGQTEGALGFPVNFSAGAAGLGADGGSLEASIAQADEALYRAKQGGRGRLVLADQR